MNNFYTNYGHGKYNFSLSIENIKNEKLKNELSISLEKQFKPFNKIDNNFSQVQFSFVENLNEYFVENDYLNIGSFKYSKNGLYFGNGEIPYVYKKENDVHQIFVKINENKNFKSNCRILDKSFSNSLDKQVSSFYYRVFLLITQYVNIEFGCTYIHGATICDEESNAILFPADSGVGKSSMLFRLGNENYYNYIADDLSIIDGDSNCYYVGRAISLKPYHLKNFPFLENILEKDMPKLQQIQWKVLKDNRLVFGMNPKKLFNGKVKEKANTKKIIHLINTNDKKFDIKKVDNDYLVKASANILMNELFLGLYHYYKITSIPMNDILMSPAEMYNKVIEIYNSVFQKTDNYLLTVPYMSNPNLMYDFLKEKQILK